MHLLYGMLLPYPLYLTPRKSPIEDVPIVRLDTSVKEIFREALADLSLYYEIMIERLTCIGNLSYQTRLAEA
jgi:hypothetical protein